MIPFENGAARRPSRRLPLYASSAPSRRALADRVGFGCVQALSDLGRLDCSYLGERSSTPPGRFSRQPAPRRRRGFSHLRPMIEAAPGELSRPAGPKTLTVALGEAQYWNEHHVDDVTASHGIEVLIPPDSGKAERRETGLDRRPVLIHATATRDRAGQGAVAETTTVNRTGLRSHQTQPTVRPVPPKRQDRCAH
jgi:hypothetical protein